MDGWTNSSGVEVKSSTLLSLLGHALAIERPVMASAGKDQSPSLSLIHISDRKLCDSILSS